MFEYVIVYIREVVSLMLIGNAYVIGSIRIMVKCLYWRCICYVEDEIVYVTGYWLLC